MNKTRKNRNNGRRKPRYIYWEYPDIDFVARVLGAKRPQRYISSYPGAVFELPMNRSLDVKVHIKTDNELKKVTKTKPAKGGPRLPKYQILLEHDTLQAVKDQDMVPGKRYYLVTEYDGKKQVRIVYIAAGQDIASVAVDEEAAWCGLEKDAPEWVRTIVGAAMATWLS